MYSDVGEGADKTGLNWSGAGVYRAQQASIMSPLTGLG